MRNLIVYLLRYGSFVLFLLLEVICISLLVNYNESQREIFVNSSGNLNGKVNSFTHRVGEIYSAHREVDSLSNVIRELRTQNLYLVSLIEEAQLDTLQLDTLHTFIPARVIQNSIQKSNNFITINKGEKDGVKSRMGVVTNQGVVGVVRDVSANYATVMSVLHRQSRTSAKIEGTGYFGNLKWLDINPNVVNLEDIPKHVNVQVGDTIQTSGFSRHFPAGIDIGKVGEVELSQGSNVYTIKVSLFADMRDLEVVYVLEDHQEVELDSLLNEGADE